MLAPVSVIVVNYNKEQYSRLCLGSILAAKSLPAQIICVDNGSADGTGEYLAGEFSAAAREKGIDAVVVHNEQNAGACTARNQAMEIATQPLIAFCDNDLAVRSSNWLAPMQEVLEQADNNGIVGPKLLFPFEPYNIECAGVALSKTGGVQYRGRGQAHDTPEFLKPVEVQCLTSACWLMKREVYEQIGGLDEVFNPAQFEDYDFCYRARQAGWRVLYEPQVEMYHFENTTTDGSVDFKFRSVTIRNGIEFKRRWREVIAGENGPAEEECGWKKLETRPIEKTGWPPMVDV